MIKSEAHKNNKKKLRQRDRAATSAAILEAAEKIFAQVGPAGARIDAIAAQAGINKAMLYYYFKNKRGLYRAVLEANLAEFRRSSLAVLSSRGSTADLVLGYVGNHFDFIGARPYYPRLFQQLMMSEDKSVERIVKTYLLPLSQRLAALIAHGVRAGEIRPLDARHTVISLIALTVFYFSAAPIFKKTGGIDVFGPMHQAQRKQEVLKFIRYALLKDPEGEN
jgi:TetR/AcrR family transcriptional regulator